MRRPIRGATFRGGRQTLRLGGVAGQRRLHAPHGRRASRPLSSPAGAGVCRGPGRSWPPSLHRGSPRAHWPRRGDHPGGVPYCPPRPAAGPGRAGEDGPAPHCSAGARPPLPRQPLEAAGWVVSPNRPCRGETERKGDGIAPRGVEASLSWTSVRSLGATAQSWPSKDQGSPLPRGFFHHPALGRRLNFALVPKILQFWKPGCALGFKRACGL